MLPWLVLGAVAAERGAVSGGAGDGRASDTTAAKEATGGDAPPVSPRAEELLGGDDEGRDRADSSTSDPGIEVLFDARSLVQAARRPARAHSVT